MKYFQKFIAAALFAACLLAPSVLHAAPKVVPIEEEACVPYQKSQTGDWHVEQIRRQLYRKAMDKYVCAAIRSRFLDVMQSVEGADSQVVEQNLSLMQDAQIVTSEVLSEGPSGDGKQYCARLRFEILPLPCEKMDHDFEAQVKMNSAYVKEGEKVVITALANRDVYLYVLSVEGNRVGVLAPNLAAGEETPFRKAGEELIIPPPGKAVRAGLPAGKNESSEFVKVIAFKENIAFLGAKGKKGEAVEFTLEEVLKKLSRISPDKWTSASAVYKIYK